MGDAVADPDRPGRRGPGFTGWNTSLQRHNTFYWDKRAWMLGPNDLTKAVVTHWLFAAETANTTAFSSPVPHSVKRPLEGRVWHAYPGQTAATATSVGWLAQRSRVGRVLDDGTSQVSEATPTRRGRR